MSATAQCRECLEQGSPSGNLDLTGSQRGSQQGSRAGSVANVQQQTDRPRPSDPRYVIIRFSSAKLLECRNTLNSNKSVFMQYGGKIIGFGHCVNILENEQGKWDSSQSLVVLWFPDETHVNLWWDCMPVIKQPDWLHGVDVVFIPARSEVSVCPPYGTGALMISDISFHDCTDGPSYSGETCQKLKEMGALVGLTATKYVVHKRGCWDPKFVTMNYFPCEHRLRDFYHSESYTEAKQARQSRGISDVVAFNLQPL